jgi:hypothetical protein
MIDVSFLAGVHLRQACVKTKGLKDIRLRRLTISFCSLQCSRWENGHICHDGIIQPKLFIISLLSMVCPGFFEGEKCEGSSFQSEQIGLWDIQANPSSVIQDCEEPARVSYSRRQLLYCTKSIYPTRTFSLFCTSS